MSQEPTSPVLGRYELRRQIARGGTARVYLAHDLRLDRPVALKMLFPELSVDSSFVERFRREAQAAANLNHANIVSVYDWGEADSTYFIVMEYVDGKSLSTLLRIEGHIDVDEACAIGVHVANALAYAHRHGVIHRDVKPGNVLITDDGRVKVTDFGIARAIGTDESLTQTGLVMGTATYFSPEQAQGHGADGRSDIYSLGVVLYEMAGGRPPFAGDTPVAIALQHVREDPPPLHEVFPEVPPAYEAIVAKAMAKDQANRYASAGELADDLERFRLGKPVAAADVPTTAIALGGTGGPGGGQIDMTRMIGAVGDGATGTGGGGGEAGGDAGPGGEGTGGRRPRRVDVKPPRSRTREYLLGLLALLLVLGLLVFFGGRGLGWFGAPQSFAVPGVSGQQLTEAVQALESVGLKVQVDRAYSSDPTGTVLSQDPSPPTDVTAGDTVTLHVSRGTARIPLPDVTGEDIVAAKRTLAKAHLQVRAIGVPLQPGQTDGDVLNELPDPNTTDTVPVGSTVTLTFASKAASIPVPSLIGDTLNQAEQVLIQSNLAIGQVTQQSSDTFASGIVISSNPVAGQIVSPQSPISITVSTGSTSAIVPFLIGDTQAQAVAALNPDFVPFGSSQPSCAADSGFVINQYPFGGVSAPKGATVSFTIGGGPPPTTTTTTSSTSSTTSTSTTTTSSTSTTTTTTAPLPCPQLP